MRILTPLLLFAALAAASQDPKSGLNASPATIEAIRACQLDAGGASTLIQALQELTAAVTADPKSLKLLATSMHKPLEERIRIMAADPKSKQILGAHGLTAKDYTIGTLALRAAAWSLSSPPTGKLAALANPANVALLKAHPDLVQRFNEAEHAPVAGTPRPR